MTNAVQFIGDNRSWIFDGIGVFALTSIVGLVVFYFGWWQKRERLTIIPKKFSLAHGLEYRVGGFDVETMQDTITRATIGVEQAKLKILCHNPTSTTVILDEIKLLNTNTGEVIVRQDAKAQRINANDFGGIDIPVGSTNNSYYKPPLWRGQITVKTIREKLFLSTPFNFGDLV